MSDIHALSGAYAVDALDDIERARFERHLAECADCRAEVASLREAAGAARRDRRRRRRPPRCATRVLAEHRHGPAAAARRRRRRRRTRASAPAAASARRRLVAAAAAVVAVVGVGGVVWQPWTDDTSQAAQLSAADRVLQRPGRRAA